MKITLLICIAVILNCTETETVEHNPKPGTVTVRSKLGLHKCCSDNEYVTGYGNTRKCVNTTKVMVFSDIPIFHYRTERTWKKFHDVFQMIPGKFDSDPQLQSNSMATTLLLNTYNVYLTDSGILYLEKPNVYNRFTKYELGNFCLDYMMKENKFQISFWVVKMKKVSQGYIYPYSAEAMIASSCFLFIVLVVYALLPRLRNMGGMILMGYVSTLLVAFVLLVYLGLGQYEEYVCYGLTLGVYYFLMASFCWMNVMSVDIWWTFRGYVRAHTTAVLRQWHVKYMMYSAYAWGLPLCLTVAMVWIDQTDLRDKPWFIKPRLSNACFMPGKEKLIYLYTPMLILISSNWLFYLLTAYNIRRISKGTSILDAPNANHHTHRSQRNRFLVYLRLSIVMGLNWILEVASFCYPGSVLFYLSDAYNSLIGLFIFIIFVCKKNIIRKLRKKMSRKTTYLSTASHKTRSTQVQTGKYKE